VIRELSGAWFSDHRNRRDSDTFNVADVAFLIRGMPI